MAPTKALFDACPLAVERLMALPPIFRTDPDIRAVLYADAKETERQEQTIAALRAEFFPQTATGVGLPIHETLLRIAVAAPGLTVQQRRDIATGVYRKLREDPTGLDWVDGVTLVLGTNQWTHEEHVAGDPASPAPGVVRITVPFDPAEYDMDAAEARIYEFTPAGWEIQMVSELGFIVGISEVGVQPL